MHYILVTKVSDYPLLEQLDHLLKGFVPVEDDEEFGEYGVWKPWRYDGFEGNLTSSKWAKICKCSQDTANRSIKHLMELGILQQRGSGRGTHYILTSGE